jgi:hypothetical protein
MIVLEPVALASLAMVLNVPPAKAGLKLTPLPCDVSDEAGKKPILS